jgi:hypothetical protein
MVGLRDVGPPLATHDRPSRAVVNAQGSVDLSESHPGHMQLAHFSNNDFSQYCLWVSFTTSQPFRVGPSSGAVAVVHPAVCDCILTVLLGRAKSKMVRSDAAAVGNVARRIVAFAQVSDYQSFGDELAVHEFPRRAVGDFGTASVTDELSIPVWIECDCPEPALRSFFYLCPETFGDGLSSVVRPLTLDCRVAMFAPQLPVVLAPAASDHGFGAAVDGACVRRCVMATTQPPRRYRRIATCNATRAGSRLIGHRSSPLRCRGPAVGAVRPPLSV